MAAYKKFNCIPAPIWIPLVSEEKRVSPIVFRSDLGPVPKIVVNSPTGTNTWPNSLVPQPEDMRLVVSFSYILIIFPVQCCFAQGDQLAPGSPFLYQPDPLDRVLDVIRIESLSAHDWDRLTIEELTEFIETISEIVQERERIYENKTTEYMSSPTSIKMWWDITQEGRV